MLGQQPPAFIVRAAHRADRRVVVIVLPPASAVALHARLLPLTHLCGSKAVMNVLRFGPILPARCEGSGGEVEKGGKGVAHGDDETRPCFAC